MTNPSRLRHLGGEEGNRWLGGEFEPFLLGLHDAFAKRVADVRHARSDLIAAVRSGDRLEPAPATGSWQVPALPERLLRPGIEISGPIGITSMAINALNPGPEGERAVGYLDDDEDSGGHRLGDTLSAVANRVGALDRSLAFDDPAKGKAYRLEPGALPFFMHRERGWHLDEPEVTIDDEPVSATLLGTALTLFHAGRHHAELGESIHFYLPKMESGAEAALYRDVLAHAKTELAFLADVPIRGVALVESLPAVYAMEEILESLGPYAAGLNAARWDLKASLLEYAMTDASQLWPDRFDVDIKTTPFLSSIFRRLVAVCGRRGGLPIGGMATALPSKDDEVNAAAANAIRADKQWEAEQGFVRGWVAHIHHMKAAADPFRARWGTRFDPSDLPSDPDAHPIRIERPDGVLTEDGTRRNLRTLLEYVEGWLRGRGAVGIDSLAGRPGKRPALMEDLATARISVAQTAQRVLHDAKSEDTGRVHTRALVSGLLDEERASIESLLPEADPARLERYALSQAITEAWIDRYLDLDFRSLGSFTREELGATR